MPYLLVVYGAIFVAGGFALLLQARAVTDAQPLPRLALLFLAGFALVHGASEWTTMAVVIKARVHEPAPGGLVAAGLLLLALSFALLYAFGAALLVRHEYRIAHVIAGGIIPLVLCAALMSHFVTPQANANAGNRASLEAIIRYVLGIPSCFSAALGLLALRGSIATEERRTLDYVGVVAAVFLTYGVLAGIVVPRAPFAPASILNANAFQQNVHLPIEVLRAACAVAIVVLMAEAFVVEPVQRLRRDLVDVRTDIRALLGFDVRERLKAVEQGTGVLEGMGPADHGSERERRIVASMREGARFVCERVADLVDACELELDRLELTAESFDLRPLLIMTAEQDAGGHGAARVRIDCPKTVPAVVADPSRVGQVLRTLLASASEHATGSTEILIGAEPERDTVAVSITVHGQGIPAYRLPYVFSREQGDVADDRGATRRTGLRLHLARSLVEAMGGQLSIESVPNSYATFRFALPVTTDHHVASHRRLASRLSRDGST